MRKHKTTRPDGTSGRVLSFVAERFICYNGFMKLGKFDILLGLVPFIVIALIWWMIANIKPSDQKNDCVVGRDSPDCLDGGAGHPLWNN